MRDKRKMKFLFCDETTHNVVVVEISTDGPPDHLVPNEDQSAQHFLFISKGLGE